MAEGNILHAYRQMYKGLLRAVQYAKPARLIVREQVRQAFRDEKNTLDPETFKRTIWFLDAAAKERGVEHKILKNLVQMHYHRKRQLASWGRAQLTTRRENKAAGKRANVLDNAYQHYDMTLAMLNKSMGLCLR